MNGARVPGWGRMDSRLVLIAKDRFLSKIFMPHGNDGCWYWTGGKDRKGYGKFWWYGKTGRAHRFAVLAWQGDFPVNYDIDHLCRNVQCVNPAHLEPVPRRVNVCRGLSPVGLNAAKTVCKHGHDFNAENTYWYKGERGCRVCRRENVKRSYDAARTRMGKIRR